MHASTQVSPKQFHGFKRSQYAGAYSFGYFLHSNSHFSHFSSLGHSNSHFSSFCEFGHSNSHFSFFLLSHSSDLSTLGTLIIEALAYHKPVHFINLQIAQLQ